MTRPALKLKEEALRNPPRDAVVKEFVARLTKLMLDRGWNQSDLAREAAKHMPKGMKFGRDNVSHYTRGRSIPEPLRLNALAQALRCTPEDLIPARPIAQISDQMPEFEVRDAGNGKAWLRVNTVVPWPVALKVMELLQPQQAA